METNKPVTSSNKATAAAVDSTALFASQLAAADTVGTAGHITLKNDNVVVEINRHGGVIGNVYLKNYRSYADFHEGKDAPLQLYEEKMPH